jgi:hypothetical protein
MLEYKFLSKNHALPTLEKYRQAPYYKAAVLGLNPTKASIPSWQHKIAA